MNHKHTPLFCSVLLRELAANDFAAPLFWRLHCFAVVHPFLYGYDFWQRTDGKIFLSVLSIRITLLLRGQSSETYLLCLHLK